MTVLTPSLNPASRHQAVVIAAANSTLEARESADIVCAGLGHDDVAINAAIASLGANGGGAVRFRQGQYYCSAPILIDYDWITLQGEGKVHWNRWLGAYPTHDAPGAPGGAQIIQTMSGQNGIVIGVTTANMHGDSRHKGIAIRDLYLFGSNYTGTGIYDTLNTDISEISTCSIQGFNNGINVPWDTPQIKFNSIQDNAGIGVSVSGFLGVIIGNICFDNGGTGIACASIGCKIIGNDIGDLTSGNGITITISDVSVVGNHIDGIPNGHGIYAVASGLSGVTVSGNVIQLTGVESPNKINNTAYNGIQFGSSTYAASYCSANGNRIGNASTATSTGFAVLINGNYNAVLGCPISGGEWNGGGASTNVSVTGTGNSVVAANNPGQQ
jgi:hypothetical protein